MKNPSDRPTIAHYSAGDTSGFPLVLSSSLGTTAEMWQPQLEHLGLGRHLISFDHRGHGSSTTPQGGYTLSELGQDVLELLDSLEIAQADFAGLSLGGMIGMWLAENAGSRIRNLALVCTYAHVASPAMWTERAASVRELGTVSVIDSSLERWFTDDFRRSDPDVTERFGSLLAGVSSEGYAGCCEAIASMDIESKLDDIEVPTLVIAGTQDVAAPPELVRGLAESITGARYAEVRAAHLANVEQADLVGSMLAEHFH